jgi:DNA-binding HxlR family transcriptional regulator
MARPIVITPVGELCSIERTLGLVGERWSLLVLREALLNRVTRFADFERALRVAPNILSDRLGGLVAAGLLEKREYREAGSRTRYAYHPTPAGESLKLVLAALQQWGDEHIPPASGPTVARETATGHPLHLEFVDEGGNAHPLDDVEFVPTANYSRAATGTR